MAELELNDYIAVLNTIKVCSVRVRTTESIPVFTLQEYVVVGQLYALLDSYVKEQQKPEEERKVVNLTLDNHRTIITLLVAISQRNVFSIDEYTVIGGLFNKFSVYVKSVTDEMQRKIEEVKKTDN